MSIGTQHLADAHRTMVGILEKLPIRALVNYLGESPYLAFLAGCVAFVALYALSTLVFRRVSRFLGIQILVIASWLLGLLLVGLVVLYGEKHLGLYLVMFVSAPAFYWVFAIYFRETFKLLREADAEIARQEADSRSGRDR